jgi:hypothetical protein
MSRSSAAVTSTQYSSLTHALNAHHRFATTPNRASKHDSSPVSARATGLCVRCRIRRQGLQQGHVDALTEQLVVVAR